MDREEALKLLCGGGSGVRQWNQRRLDGEAIPDLSGADLSGAFLNTAILRNACLANAKLREAHLHTANLSEANLAKVDLNNADVRNAKLADANLTQSDLSGANLAYANLSRANLNHAQLRRTNLAWAFLTDANLSDAELGGCDLHNANLRCARIWRANLTDANLFEADLTGANLRNARLMRANLRGAKLRGTDLSNASLNAANLAHADLRSATLRAAGLFDTVISDALLMETNLSKCRAGGTHFASNLSEAVGLDSVIPIASSKISLDCMLAFQDDLPEKFLRGCGVAEEEIAYFRSRIGRPIRFYSCFISFSTKDEEFATRLHNDLQAAGVRCWKWDHDARTGESLWGEIDQAIRVHDKLVLIASESSLKSPAVNREIERSIVQEDERTKQKQEGQFDGNPNVLFPVRVDDYIFNGWENERKADVTKKVIADATNWHDPDVYAEVRDRLIRDLSTSAIR